MDKEIAKTGVVFPANMEWEAPEMTEFKPAMRYNGTSCESAIQGVGIQCVDTITVGPDEPK